MSKEYRIHKNVSVEYRYNPTNECLEFAGPCDGVWLPLSSSKANLLDELAHINSLLSLIEKPYRDLREVEVRSGDYRISIRYNPDTGFEKLDSRVNGWVSAAKWLSSLAVLNNIEVFSDLKENPYVE